MQRRGVTKRQKLGAPREENRGPRATGLACVASELGLYVLGTLKLSAPRVVLRFPFWSSCEGWAGEKRRKRRNGPSLSPELSPFHPLREEDRHGRVRSCDVLFSDVLFSDVFANCTRRH